LEPDGDHEEPLSKRPRKEEAKSALQKALEKAEREIATIVADGDVTTMGPKKRNADLKRDVQDTLYQLERRTQRAIASLLKERLERDAETDVPELDSRKPLRK
jgi:polyhydroxyalkanoate synthesis regulator phasin